MSGDFGEKIKLMASYTYMLDAEVSKDTDPSKVGLLIENIPEHAYRLSARYYPQGSHHLGWFVGLGIRGESSKPVEDLDQRVPSYTLFDTEAGYNAQHWSALLSVRNMFDKNYYSGANNNEVMAYGYSRLINFTMKFRY